MKVLNGYKMDCCCNGHETLAIVLGRLRTEDTEVIEALQSVIDKQDSSFVKDWQNASMSELIDHNHLENSVLFLKL